MRNVKCGKLSIALFIILSFYLNYEECKVAFKVVSKSDSISFILTMRNVKFNKNERRNKMYKGFILTMRNVKYKG